jgi:hypothetical protein
MRRMPRSRIWAVIMYSGDKFRYFLALLPNLGRALPVCNGSTDRPLEQPNPEKDSVRSSSLRWFILTVLASASIHVDEVGWSGNVWKTAEATCGDGRPSPACTGDSSRVYRLPSLRPYLRVRLSF